MAQQSANRLLNMLILTAMYSAFGWARLRHEVVPIRIRRDV